jgi:hypothetical protein
MQTDLNCRDKNKNRRKKPGDFAVTSLRLTILFIAEDRHTANTVAHGEELASMAPRSDGPQSYVCRVGGRGRTWQSCSTVVLATVCRSPYTCTRQSLWVYQGGSTVSLLKTTDILFPVVNKQALVFVVLFNLQQALVEKGPLIPVCNGL